MATTRACPDVAQYKRLASGQIAGTDKEILLNHLEGCDACALQLEKLSETDTLEKLMHEVQTLGDRLGSEAVARLLERLRYLKPGDRGTAKAPIPGPIVVACSCGRKLKVKAVLAGKKIKCTHCQAVLRVPGATPPAEDQTLSPVAVVAPTSAAGARQAGVAEKDQQLWDFLAPRQEPDEIGRLGDYRILKVLGAGGMGVVFEAEDPRLKRKLAVKAMLPALAASPTAKQRFLREAQTAAAIEHDHIVPIFQVGEDRGVLFIAMPFLKGEPLDERLKRERVLPVAEVLRIGREAAKGLAAAHAAGLVHRDIKPANLWLETLPGEQGASASASRVKILDFGLARAAADDAQLTQHGAIIGTPAYMAPEQAAGRVLDARCDLFSLGCVLYRMCTGRQPFNGAETVSTIIAVATENPTSPRELRPDVPAALSELVMQLLAKDPEERPASAQAVAEALQRIEAETAAAAARIPKKKRGVLSWLDPAGTILYRPQKKGARVFWPVAILAGVFAVVVLAGTIILWPTLHGTVEIELNDPGIVVAFDNTGATVTADDKPIKLAPGEHGVIVRRGDFQFETAKFLLMNGKTIRLKVVLLEGKIEVSANGQVIGAEKLPAPAAAVNAGADKPAAIATDVSAGLLPKTFTNRLGMEFVLVPKGKFLMGGGGGRPGEEEVVIPQDFYLGKYAVTQADWEKVTGLTPSSFSRTGSGKDRVKDIADLDLMHFPVESVTWKDTQLYLEALNNREKETGWHYRLPKETEREYACRGGPTSDKFFYAYDFYIDKPTNQLLPGQANFGHGNGLGRTCKVGSYKPNSLGLHDMQGNVHEWCEDADTNADGASYGVYRGGSWRAPSGHCRAAYRYAVPPPFRSSSLGLRVARVPVGNTPVALPPSPRQESLVTPWYDSGSWHLADSELHQVDTRGGHLFLLGNPVWTDYDVEVEMETLAGHSEAYVAFRATAPRHYLYAALGAFGNTRHAVIGKEGKGPAALSLVPGQMERGRYYRLRVEARGSHFNVLLDGQLLLALESTKHPSGCVGVGTVDTDAKFRNLKVTRPDGKVLLEGWPGDLANGGR